MEIKEYTLRKTPDNDVHVTLVKERTIYYTGLRLSDPQSAYVFFKTIIGLSDRAEEYVYMVALDAKNKPVGIFEVSHGTVTTSIMPTREILIRALMCAATNIILVHNHPSGDPTPSAEDIRVTKKLFEAGSLVGIMLVDHLIVGDDRYISMKETGSI